MDRLEDTYPQSAENALARLPLEAGSMETALARADTVDTMLGPPLHDAAPAVFDASFAWVSSGTTAVSILEERR